MNYILNNYIIKIQNVEFVKLLLERKDWEMQLVSVYRYCGKWARFTNSLHQYKSSFGSKNNCQDLLKTLSEKNKNEKVWT